MSSVLGPNDRVGWGEYGGKLRITIDGQPIGPPIDGTEREVEKIATWVKNALEDILQKVLIAKPSSQEASN